jgi:DNA invertase Pin-like site-specific DNA recombinase
MARHPNYICPQIEDEVLKMIKEGCSYAEISRKVNISDHIITKIKRKHGMLPPLIPKKCAWWN